MPGGRMSWRGWRSRTGPCPVMESLCLTGHGPVLQAGSTRECFPFYVGLYRYGALAKSPVDEAGRRVFHVKDVGELDGRDVGPFDVAQIAVAQIGRGEICPGQAGA